MSIPVYWKLATSCRSLLLACPEHRKSDPHVPHLKLQMYLQICNLSSQTNSAELQATASVAAHPWQSSQSPSESQRDSSEAKGMVSGQLDWGHDHSFGGEQDFFGGDSGKCPRNQMVQAWLNILPFFFSFFFLLANVLAQGCLHCLRHESALSKLSLTSQGTIWKMRSDIPMNGKDPQFSKQFISQKLMKT